MNYRVISFLDSDKNIENYLKSYGLERMKRDFYAHIRKSEDGSLEYQTLREHCENTAYIAAQILHPIGLKNVGNIVGKLHDMGKFKEEFQKYLLDAAEGRSVSRGAVVHTFSGAKYMLDTYHPNLATRQAVLAEIIAIAIASHHGQFDIEIDGKENGFVHRTTKDDGFDECINNYVREYMTHNEIAVLMEKATLEFDLVVNRISELAGKNVNATVRYNEMSFYIALLDRLVLSALMEGDRQDTALFMNRELKKDSPAVDWGMLCETVDEKILNLPNTSSINIVRRKISDICATCGENDKGVYRLNIPTGGGKTLSSLRFAIHHVNAHKMKRIIFCTPLLSILEQNAAIIREYIEDDSIVLEHHSNVINMDYVNCSESITDNELLIDNWEAPVIITTLVQFLNTLFSGKTASIRRFHSLIDSIIVIDEVQNVPVKMMSLFNLAVNFLSEVCGATIVLSSATQPSLALTEHPIQADIIEMVPYNREMWDAFKRTEIKECTGITIDKFSELVIEKMKGKRSLLVVCNKKDAAERVYRDVKNVGIDCLHLSASMCMEHRRDVLKSMKSALESACEENPFVCISTQVIEAGVDVSFECVIRLMAGMDSIVQAAGRCNRNGESKECLPVYVVNLLGEDLGKLTEIKRGKDATQSLLVEYHADKNKYGCDLTSDTAIHSFYEKYYREMNVGEMDYFVTKHSTNLLDMLGVNNRWRKNDEYFHHQAFKEAGMCFEVFDAETTDVIVPYGEGASIIQELNSCSDWDISRKTELVKKAKQFTVSIYSWQRKKMEEDGILYWCMDHTIAYITRENYDDATGLLSTRKQLEFMEV